MHDGYHSATSLKKINEAATLLCDFRNALRERRLTLDYQPKIDLVSGKVAGIEGLLRWNHDKYGAIAPSEIIPLVEMSDLIEPLTLWTIDEAAAHASTWRDTGQARSVAINLSTSILLDRELPRKINEILAAHELAPGRLELEITESALIAKDALHVMSELRALGVRFTLDDFGTGYASLEYLSRMPVQSLKIDVSFVRRMSGHLTDCRIVGALIDLAHELGLRVIAEGVENIETLLQLKAMACDEAQGYYIAPPLCMAKAAKLPKSEQWAAIRDRLDRAAAR